MGWETPRACRAQVPLTDLPTTRTHRTRDTCRAGHALKTHDAHAKRAHARLCHRCQETPCPFLVIQGGVEEDSKASLCPLPRIDSSTCLLISLLLVLVSAAALRIVCMLSAHVCLSPRVSPAQVHPWPGGYATTMHSARPNKVITKTIVHCGGSRRRRCPQSCCRYCCCGRDGMFS
eukprot:2437345-Pleurochrysis_carterae.AAC.1